MDAGEHGQGPDSCNLAACHGCALLLGPSCEEFNRFLDRGLVIGTFTDPHLGFFSDLQPAMRGEDGRSGRNQRLWIFESSAFHPSTGPST
jgi:hypothetical protein